MTTTRRTYLRRVMEMAHAWRRSVRCTMAEALRTAWRRIKLETAPVVRIRHLKSVCPTSNRLAGARYGRTRDWQAGRQIASVGY